LIYQYARALYLDRGGDPRDLADIPWRDIEAWLAIHDTLDSRRAIGGVPNDS